MTPFGWASLGVLFLYLAAFFAGSALATKATGRSVWLFGQASGIEARPAFGFRLSFGVAFFGPLVLTAAPTIAALDPLWSLHGLFGAAPGHFITISGAMLVFAAQMAMGASWRVGVAEDAVGALVTGGLYDLSRNPVFVGQMVLLTGVALAIPSVVGVAAVGLFWASAFAQIHSEERVLTQTHGQSYRHDLATVPRLLGYWKQPA